MLYILDVYKMKKQTINSYFIYVNKLIIIKTNQLGYVLNKL